MVPCRLQALCGRSQFPRREELMPVIKRQDEGFHRQVIPAHLAQVLEAVAEEIRLRSQQPARCFQTAVLPDHSKKDRWRISALADDPAVEFVHRGVEAASGSQAV